MNVFVIGATGYIGGAVCPALLAAVRSVGARRELGWRPSHDSVIEWIEREMPLG